MNIAVRHKLDTGGGPLVGSGSITSPQQPYEPATAPVLDRLPIEAGSAGRIEFLGAPIDRYTMDEVIALAATAMRERRRLQHGDVNVAKLVSFGTDPELLRCVAASDIICPDGMGVVWGCRLMGLPLRERVTGIDLMMRILAVCARDGLRPYFLGARQEVIEKTVEAVRNRYPAIQIAGCRNGYFRAGDEEGIVAAIRASRADCLFVGMSSPLKERFLNRYRDALDVPLQVGVGGAFDVLSGTIPRAPMWVQRAGLEWLFRLAQEPRRLGPRYFKTNARYIAMLAAALAAGGKIAKARSF